eukprot:TRINITY_DN22857_c0_g1_i1.p1 TRINITY_DN22857_c0_g1~~TRINITY_DN22857_c0_g1_i1.p1  ORF type:complete len:459 (+),score=45.33 TRINITY_DN22857_c0_g1_i1:110-1486(+)
MAAMGSSTDSRTASRSFWRSDIIPPALASFATNPALRLSVVALRRKDFIAQPHAKFSLCWRFVSIGTTRRITSLHGESVCCLCSLTLLSRQPLEQRCRGPHRLKHFNYALSASLASGATITPATAVPAVLLGPVFSTVGTLLYERWQGSAASLNLIKCSIATILFATVVVSSDAMAATIIALTPRVARMLMLSALLGVVIGDLLWLQALKLMGARMVILQTTLQPLISALAGAAFLNQPLAPSTGLAVAAVCAGLALAQAAKEPAAAVDDMEAVVAMSNTPAAAIQETAGTKARGLRSPLLLGTALNMVNLVLDTAGHVLTRRYGHGLTTWQINMVRFGSGTLMTFLGLLLVNLWSALTKPDEPRPEWAVFIPAQPLKVWAAIGCGATLCAFLAPACSNYALFGLPLGAWSALNSLDPVWAIPFLWAMRRERTSRRGILGAALAVAGAAACSVAVRVH